MRFFRKHFHYMAEIPRIYKLLFQLIRIALGTQRGLDGDVSEKEWHQLLDESRKQALLALCCDAVCSLEEHQMPPQQVLLQWMALSNKVRQRNGVLNDRCVELLGKLRADGFERAAILKGQGNATMYPNPLSRQCGDIDVWVDTDEASAIKYCSGFYAEGLEMEVGAEHIEIKVFDDAKVEFHFNLGAACGAIGKPLVRWFGSQMPQRIASVTLPNGRDISVPDIYANIVHQASHIYHHVLSEGVGLRQIIDFYLLMRKAKDENVDYGFLRDTLDKLHLLRITRALFHVLREVLAASDDILPWPVHKAYGEYLLGNIIEGGNFGRANHDYIGPNVKTLHGMWLRFKLYAEKMRFVGYDPYISVTGVQRIARGVLKKTRQFFKGELK